MRTSLRPVDLCADNCCPVSCLAGIDFAVEIRSSTLKVLRTTVGSRAREGGMMRWRGVHHVEFAVLHYDDSIAFYNAMFGWLGYSSFSTMGLEYQSVYYMTRVASSPHSYIGIQPARSGSKLQHHDQAVGINHIALWARSRQEVDRFHSDFLTSRAIPATDEPKEYPQYWPGYYAVFFDDPINGIHWELAWLPKFPTPRQVWASYRSLRVEARSRPDLANSVPGLALQAMRKLPRRT